MAKEMTLDEYLKHKPTARGGSILKNWKRDKPPIKNIWLHTAASFSTLWQHGYPRIVTIEETGMTEVWGGSFNCWDSEDSVKKQNSVNKDTGARKNTVERCPFCRLIEHVRMLVYSDKINWLDEMFHFEGDNGDPRIIHAAGLYNGYRGDLTAEEKNALKDAGIRRNDAWMESGIAKCNYVYSVVDDDNVGAGVQIAIETSLLGSKVQGIIRDKIAEFGEKGNPLINPYMIQWKYQPDESIQDRYHALSFMNHDLRDDVRELIVVSQPPDISNLVRDGDATLLRTSMEEHYIGPENLINWDKIFEGCMSDYNNTDNIKEKVDESDDNDDIVACDECNKPMHIDDDVCKECGKDYSATTESVKEEDKTVRLPSGCKVDDDMPF